VRWQLGNVGGRSESLLEDRKTKKPGVEMADGRTFRIGADC
jgi:hypothetical protein